MAASQGQAFCLCHQALGNTDNRTMTDLVYVRPETFEPAKTREIAAELGGINSRLLDEGRRLKAQIDGEGL